MGVAVWAVSNREGPNPTGDAWDRTLSEESRNVAVHAGDEAGGIHHDAQNAAGSERARRNAPTRTCAARRFGTGGRLVSARNGKVKHGTQTSARMRSRRVATVYRHEHLRADAVGRLQFLLANHQ